MKIRGECGGLLPVERNRLGLNRFAQGRCHPLDDNMGVGAAKSEAADPDDGLVIDGGLFGDDLDVAGFKIDVLVGLVKMQVGRDRSIVQDRNGFDQPGDPGGGFQMPHVGFDRSDI